MDNGEFDVYEQGYFEQQAIVEEDLPNVWECNVYCDYNNTQPAFPLSDMTLGSVSEDVTEQFRPPPTPGLISQSEKGTEQPIEIEEQFSIAQDVWDSQLKNWIYAITTLVAIGSLSSFFLLCFWLVIFFFELL